MKTIDGYLNVVPVVKKIGFNKRGMMDIYLEDGRIISVLLSVFPDIKKLSSAERQKWQSLGEGFTFDKCNEVYHIAQILGKYENYQHQ